MCLQNKRENLGLKHLVLNALMSALTYFGQLPRPFELGTSLLMTQLIHEDARETFPYNLERIAVGTLSVSSCIPSLPYGASVGTSLSSLTLKIRTNIREIIYGILDKMYSVSCYCFCFLAQLWNLFVSQVFQY